MVIPQISDRSQLRSVLDASLSTSEDEQQDELTSSDRKPKSFIIESNLNDIKGMISEDKLACTVTDTKDKTLKIVKLSWKGSDPSSFYVDTSDSRFLIFHSLNTSEISTSLIYKLVQFNSSKLDFPWFSSTKLEEVSKFGKETGFSLKFNNKFLNENSDDYEDELQQVSMRFWGGCPGKVIKNLRKDPMIQRGISLSSLGLRYKTESGFIKTNISNFGRLVVMKGDSIDSYFNLIYKTKENYSSLLKSLEEKYRISYRKNESGFKFSGGYTIIDFNKNIEDLTAFAKILTSCSAPFRLWGIWSEIEEDYIKINGVDLHTNDKINIELTPNWMRIFLPSNSCGNVIARLFTNLQTYYDSQIKLVGNDNAKII